MATINNVKLSIKKGAHTSDVTVTYDICFSFCERLDGTVFVEMVTLKGDDLITDDHLTTLHNHCIKATKACVSRKIARKVNNNVLDEDPKILWIQQSDEVYARVTLTPFKPGSAAGSSNIVNAYF